MEEQIYEKEIDLMQLFREIWKKLWIIILAGVAGGILVGGYKMIPAIKGVSAEVLEEQKETYEKERKEYETQFALNENAIENLENSIEKIKEYNKASVLMQIDPYNVQIGTMTFYVNTGYQIKTDIVYQNPDYTASLLNAYATIATDGTLYTYIHDNLSEKIEIRYIQELIQIVSSASDRTIDVKVTHGDEEMCEEILSLIKACFEEYKSIFEAAIGVHEMDLIAEALYSTVDLSLESSQNQNLERENTLLLSLDTKQKEMEELKEPEMSVNTRLAMVKNAVKYAVIGGVLGAFLAAAVILFLFMINTSIRDEKDVQLYLKLPVLSEIPVISGKEATVKRDKLKKKERLNQYGGM